MGGEIHRAARSRVRQTWAQVSAFLGRDIFSPSSQAQTFLLYKGGPIIYYSKRIQMYQADTLNRIILAAK